jgi:hypothetical protein
VVAEAFGGLRGDGGLLAAAVALASLSYIAYLVSVFEVVF